MVSDRTNVATQRPGLPADDTAVCGSCNRILKDPSEWIRSGNRTMCVACYEMLLNPLWKCCSGSGLG